MTVGGKSIAEVTSMSTVKALEFFEELGRGLTERESLIARQILKEIGAFWLLTNVGLDYLTLHREAGTLSGGESADQAGYQSAELGRGSLYPGRAVIGLRNAATMLVLSIP